MYGVWFKALGSRIQGVECWLGGLGFKVFAAWAVPNTTA